MTARILWGCLAAVSIATAQQPPTFERRIEVVSYGDQAAGALMLHQEGGVPGGATLQFVSAEVGLPGRLVKGAPYTAEAVTETVQTLADGNRITRKTTSQVARDSEGRTRRQDKFGAVGPGAAHSAHEVVFIHDPVAKVSWVLEVEAKTARKMPLPPGDLKPGQEAQMTLRHRSESGGKVEERVVAMRHAGAAAAAPGKTESLGKRNVEGVVAEGTRTTLTIPAGEMGNERPIEVASERWYSPELQAVVMTRNSDPRMGETTYRLTNIVRAEPPRSLFDVPPDYKVTGLQGDVKIIRETKQ